MRWNVSLKKPGAVVSNRSSFGVLQYLVVAYLLFVAIYPIPGWFGIPFPSVPIQALQIFIDRAAVGFFQFIAVAALIALLLPNGSIARVRRKEAYKRLLSWLRLKAAPALFAFSFVIIAITFGSHLLFNIRDSFGEICEGSIVNETPLSAATGGLDVCTVKNLQQCTPDTTRVVTVDTRNLCTPTRVYLQKNEHYQLILNKDPNEPWIMAGVPSSTGGMPIASFLPNKNDPFLTYMTSLGRTALMVVLYPFRRSFDRPFGRVILRYGETGNEENFIDPDEDPRPDGRLDEKFTPRRDGELFVYLNKPVSGLWPGIFHDFNSGLAKVFIVRIPN
jgi:hypothetical protein